MMQIYGPANTIGISQSRNVRLSKDSVGVLDHGHRFVVVGDRTARVDDSGAPGRLVGVVHIPAFLGDGFLFYGERAVYFAASFEAPLHRLGADDTLDFYIGPRCVLLLGPSAASLVSLPDGSPISGGPADMRKLAASPTGFMVVATTNLPNNAHFSRDGRTWQQLPVSNIVDLEEDGDAILMRSRDGFYKVRADGDPFSVGDPRGQAFLQIKRHRARRELRKELRASHGPAQSGGEAPAEGAMLVHGWVPTLRANDEWFAVDGHRVHVAQTRRRQMKTIGGPVGSDETCYAAAATRQPLLVCVQPPDRVRVYRVDLDSGERVLEREVRTQERFDGPPRDLYPEAIFVRATCESGKGGVCVRGPDGLYHTQVLPPGDERKVLVFPDDVVQMGPDGAGGIALWHAKGRSRSFSAAQMKDVTAALGWDLPPKSDLPYVDNGALLLGSTLRLFESPNPFKPLPASPTCHALDVPLDGADGPRLNSVPGVIVTAGPHALRLDKGKLYETNDGWTTWYEVPAPPGGVPDDLAGATCDARGCLLGPWVRVGWEKPAAF
jgi:hypothetical protein